MFGELVACKYSAFEGQGKRGAEATLRTFPSCSLRSLVRDCNLGVDAILGQGEIGPQCEYKGVGEDWVLAALGEIATVVVVFYSCSL